jgi:hypothetical protein
MRLTYSPATGANDNNIFTWSAPRAGAPGTAPEGAAGPKPTGVNVDWSWTSAGQSIRCSQVNVLLLLTLICCLLISPQLGCFQHQALSPQTGTVMRESSVTLHRRMQNPEQKPYSLLFAFSANSSGLWLNGGTRDSFRV